ncbi:PREDICTED: uncharacterized protein LOC109586730 [Amphimedon queenslandica]|uniref:Uncharacterized protein n=1 Tax=Amphimedon queenslandica TaxID=400682 RepID=A0AAN0JNU8_AMPQE|nr:PREDICTED: uncharacterized protein LOC109586730 [Amphimedon queenslandica]|eukprot:XP_019858497.1 PREDICTED: uncharacterized protein LOC109586730 [Amphimedon queenslandica]
MFSAFAAAVIIISSHYANSTKDRVCDNLMILDVAYDVKGHQLHMQWTYSPCPECNYNHFNITVIDCMKEFALQVLILPINISIASLNGINISMKIGISVCSQTKYCYGNECSIFVNDFLRHNNKITKTLQTNETLSLNSSIDYYEDFSNGLVANGKFYSINSSIKQLFIQGTEALEYNFAQVAYTISVNGENAFKEFGRDLTLQEVFTGQSICGNGWIQRRGIKYRIIIKSASKPAFVSSIESSSIILPSSTDWKMSSNNFQIVSSRSILVISSTDLVLNRKCFYSFQQERSKAGNMLAVVYVGLKNNKY